MALEPPVLIVCTVPDFEPQSEDEIKARAVASTIFDLSPQAIFLDMCYHPSPETQLIRVARRSGVKVIWGIEAFFHQDIASSSLWVGLSAAQLPLEEVRVVINECYVQI